MFGNPCFLNSDPKNPLKQVFLTPKQVFFDPKTGFFDPKTGNYYRTIFAKFLRVRKDWIFPKISELQKKNYSKTRENKKLRKFLQTQGLIEHILDRKKSFKPSCHSNVLLLPMLRVSYYFLVITK